MDTHHGGDEWRAEIRAIRTRLAALEAEIAAVRTALDASGTATTTPPQTTSARILHAVREQAREPHELVALLGISPTELQETLAELRAEDQIANIGMEGRPRWFRRLGDACTTAELVAAVRYLLTQQPMTLQELAHVTGARYTRVNGARNQLERNGIKLVNSGNWKIARWFIPGEESAAPAPTKKARKR